ncbi:MAG: hypothetical protein ABR521_12205 [Gaiellaceae bacterium]
MDASERYAEIADDLAAHNAHVEVGKMFGMPCIKTNGKAAAGLWQDSMVFKLPVAETREGALSLEGAAHFDPRIERTRHAA